MTSRPCRIFLTVFLFLLSNCGEDVPTEQANLLAETDDACCPTPEAVLARHVQEEADEFTDLGEASGALVSTGAALYKTHGCAVCHGNDGGGNGPVAATLNPAPRDFRNPATYKNGRTVKSIAKSINWGVAGSASVMPAFPHIPGDDRVKIAYFINSLQVSR